MKLVSAHIKNFKLLKSVNLAFSIDGARPLTVIRAENGSGKTSILYALRWAMYGAKGVPTQYALHRSKEPPQGGLSQFRFGSNLLLQSRIRKKKYATG